ncbi:hypothetical protein VHUM_03313 [Vanrija humicola]|uniref:HIG1 domain-containing protein n=1 Tax=Vanrija humicola TaxID=5417 RepID=A0A7D8Z0V4_VANHU|nr:hypothetical protein VHUM_03313 [Vanrija humicola]
MVPLGAIATTAALLGASASLRSGNRKQFQNFLRLRVAAQGVTVVAMVVGAFMLTEKAEDAAEKRARARTSGLKREGEPRATQLTQPRPPAARRPGAHRGHRPPLSPAQQDARVRLYPPPARGRGPAGDRRPYQQRAQVMQRVARVGLG